MTNPFYDAVASPNTRIDIDGPFWSAKAKIIKLEEHDFLDDSVAFRSLFVSREAKSIRDRVKLNLPGTVLALCWVSEIKIQLNRSGEQPRFEWDSKPLPSTDNLSIRAIRGLLNDGWLTLLLLQAKVDDWNLTGPLPLPLPRFVCLAGEIHLVHPDKPGEHENFLNALYKVLSLSRHDLKDRKGENAGALRLLSPVALHASGMTLYGKTNENTKFLWRPEPFIAPFLLTRERPDPKPVDRKSRPAFRLTVETERLTQEERSDLKDVWDKLKKAFNAREPKKQQTPRAVTLEFVNEIPNSYWRYLSVTGSAEIPVSLELEDGEVSITLSDQPLYDAKTPPNSVARFWGKAEFDSDAGGLIVRIRNRAADAESKLTYEATNSNDGWQEEFRLKDALCAHSPVETPKFLRRVQGLPPPAWERAGGFLFSLSTDFAQELDAATVSQKLRTAFAEAGYALAQPKLAQPKKEAGKWQIKDENGNEKRIFLLRLEESESEPLTGRINVYCLDPTDQERTQPPLQKTIEPPLLWAFMPLSDGWAQLPVPNLTEQIYLDAKLANVPTDSGDQSGSGQTTEATPSPLLRGAVSYGNDLPEVIAKHPTEHAWSMTLTDAAAIEGTWTLIKPQTDSEFRIKTVTLDFIKPELYLNGLCWLSTHSPTVENALPNLDDWIGGLAPISLKTVDSGTDIFPPLLHCVVSNFKLVLRETPSEANKPLPLGAEMKSLNLSFEVDAQELTKMEIAGVLPKGLFERHLPLVWRRHATLPMIQALPITQSQSPPNYPSPSRQLIPYSLPPLVWPFEQTGGANDWLTLKSASEPAKEWADVHDLPLVSLSLPGLEMEPRRTDAMSPHVSLVELYRHDLPYLDEIYALAQLPKITKQSGETSPLPEDPPPQPPKALAREDYQAFWQTLSERASLAAADATLALDFANDPNTVTNLIDPLPWPVPTELKTEAYPGELTLQDYPQKSLVLKEELALQGISGHFEEEEFDEGGKKLRRLRRLPDGSSTTAKTFAVTSGSMAAHPTGDGTYGDQRGLLRSATSTKAAWLKTPVTLRKTNRPDEDQKYQLVTARKAIELSMGGMGWNFWFRDLPVADSNNTFERLLSNPRVNPDNGIDINDPKALSKERNFLYGYEWRLGPPTQGTQPQEFLPFFGLHFYPLTLESVAWNAEKIAKVEIIGRLQLPYAPDSPKTSGELTEVSDAVRLIFTEAGGRLTLTDVTPAAKIGNWPLTLQGGELGAAPQLLWGKISVNNDGGTSHLEFSKLQLNFFLFEQEWAIACRNDDGDMSLLFPSPKKLEVKIPPPTQADDGLFPTFLTIDLGTASQASQCDATLSLKLKLKNSFAADLSFPLVGEQTGTLAPTLKSLSLFGDKLKLDVPDKDKELRFLYTHRAFEFKWKGLKKDNAASDLQLLPGVSIRQPDGTDASEAPGFAVVRFEPDAMWEPANPKLKIQTAFVEALFPCRWREFFELEPTGKSPLDANRLYNSSAGNLVIGYTAKRESPKAEDFTETLLLNGFLEVKNLLSWPTAMIRDEKRKRLVLPALIASDGKRYPPLNHLRHQMRILFNQHQLPVTDVLEITPAADKTTIFQFRADRTWQFLTVVEHHFFRIDEQNMKVQAESSWTTTQEIRLLSPERFKQFLEDFKDNDWLNPADTADGQKSLQGYYQPALRKQLVQVLNELAGLAPPPLLIEASAAHWLQQSERAATDTATSLQFLPSGSQNAVLSAPADYGPSDPHAPQWALLQIPFIGRLQPQQDDGLDSNQMGRDLQVDPILRLKRGRVSGLQPTPMLKALSLSLSLASWGFDKAAPTHHHIPIFITEFEWLDSRAMARLDPTSLAENWFRLNNPVAERTADGIQSVVAALPNGPARLSRASALQQAFVSNRPFYPPRRLDDFLPPPSKATDQMVWREESLLAQQGVTFVREPDNKPPYAWAIPGLQFFESGIYTRGTPLDVAFHPRGEHLAVAGKDRVVRIFDAKDGKVIHRFSITGEAQRIAYSRTGQFLGVACNDGTAYVWQWRGTDFTPVFVATHNAAISDLVFSEGESRLATASDDRTVKIWNLDVRPPTLRKTITPNDGEIYKIAFNPKSFDGKILAIVGSSRSARVWDETAGTLRVLPDSHRNQINWVSYSKSGKFLVTASADNKLRVRDGATGDMLSNPDADYVHDTSDPLADVYTAVFSEDEKFVVSASGDATARVWRVEKRAEKPQRGLVGSPLMHDSRVNFATFFQNGDRLQVLTASDDGTARLWDAMTSQQLSAFQHNGAVKALSVNFNETSFVTVSDDGMVRFWDVNKQTLVWEKRFDEGNKASARVSRHTAATLLPARLEAKDFLFSAPKTYVKDLDQKKPEGLKPIFDRKGLALSMNLQVDVVTTGKQWNIIDKDVDPELRYELLLEAGRFGTSDERINVYGTNLPSPLSLAVSPYAWLKFDPIQQPQDYDFALTSVELLCFEPLANLLRPVASRLVERKKKDDGTMMTEDERQELLLNWARETHRRLSPESPVAILRQRAIEQRKETASGPILKTNFSFAIVPAITVAQRTTRRAFGLRAPVKELRFQEGQFGGSQLPEPNNPKLDKTIAETFELAPPQVIGVQPIAHRLIAKPHDGEAGEDRSWPWQVSLLRTSIRFTAEAKPEAGDSGIPPSQGVVGKYGKKLSTDKPETTLKQEITLWWQAVQNFVQFRSSHSAAPTGGLPPLFRAPAIKSLLPRLPQPPLPVLVGSQDKPNDLTDWQPVLPGRMRHLVTGARPGVFYAMYNHLLRQQIAYTVKEQTSRTLASGCVPVQHRTTRPAPLPRNAKPTTALQTWASFFDAEKNLLISDQPVDEAFFAAAGGKGAPNRMLRLTLQPVGKSIELLHGGITPAWDGTLVFAMLADNDGATKQDQDEWEIFLTVSDGTQTFTYSPPPVPVIPDDPTATASVTPDATLSLIAGKPTTQAFLLSDSEKSRLQAHMRTKRPGESLTVRARVKPKPAAGADDKFFQELAFPLRVLDTTRPPLPLRPRFSHFEDPEYNRRLASQAGRAAVIVAVNPSGQQNQREQHTLTLSTDRREYNPTGRLFLRLDWEESEPTFDGKVVELKIKRLDSERNGIELKPDPSENDLLQTGEIHALTLNKLKDSQNQDVLFRAGDYLELTIRVSKTGEVEKELGRASLMLPIVEQPVIPVPEAAYALLRHNSTKTGVVECVRFAWAPSATRIELVNPNDLRVGVVRRRAVFRWTDSVIPEEGNSYALQKIAMTGASHFPRLSTTTEQGDFQSPQIAAGDLEFAHFEPNMPENDAVGKAQTKILRDSPAFKELKTNDNPNIVLQDEGYAGADRMTEKLKRAVDRLAALVVLEWPGLKLRVIAAWAEGNAHGDASVHYEARGVDMTTSDKDFSKLGRLGRLAVNAGFEWVYYENERQIHASVSI